MHESVNNSSLSTFVLQRLQIDASIDSSLYRVIYLLFKPHSKNKTEPDNKKSNLPDGKKRT